jgi:hypothetical protein
MSTFEVSHVTWRRSSLCSGGDCVEVAAAHYAGTDQNETSPTVFLMRNSRDPEGQVLRLTSGEWEGLVAYIKQGAAS